MSIPAFPVPIERGRFGTTDRLDLARDAKEIVSSNSPYLASCYKDCNTTSSSTHHGTSSSSSASNKRSQFMPAFDQGRSQSTALSEATPIISDDERTRRNYQSTGGIRDREAGDNNNSNNDDDDDDDDATKDSQQRAAGSGNRNLQGHTSQQAPVAKSRVKSWYDRIADKYGSLELENKGSVARDHLALERTFLAWLRTSLAFASVGIAVTQLFRLSGTSSSASGIDATTTAVFPFAPLLSSASLSNDADTMTAAYSSSRLRGIGKPLGATFIGISIFILLVGFHRYFESQYWIVKGKFPASRGSVAFIALLTAALIITALVVILAVSPGSDEV